MKKGHFEVINLDRRAYLKPDEYLNGWARYCGWKATIVFDSLCRHADRNRESFPSIQLMANEHGVSYNTIRRGVKTLEDWKIIKKEQKKSKKGKFLHNTYYILAKNYWKNPSPSTGLRDQPEPCGEKPVALPRAHKGTHKKGTHTSINILAKREFGNSDINKILSYMKEKLSLPKLDDSEKTNRRYSWLLLKKFNGLSGCLKLIEVAAADEWFRNNITSAKELYYKGIKLIARKRGNGGAVDAREI